MYYLGIKYISLLSILLAALSCTEPVTGFSRIDYVIPDHINIKTDDLKKAFSGFKTDNSAGVYIVVVLYSYSAGAEKISISGDSELKTVSGQGRLKALVKVMDEKKIVKAVFLEGRGGSREEMISSLVKEMKLKMIN